MSDKLNRFKITGQYDTSGNFGPFTKPIEVVQFGNTLRTPDDGMVWSVKDNYGDWVSPTMLRIGLKSKHEVVPA